MPHKMSSQLEHHLMQANLYGLLAKKYEYVDPAKHIHFYQKYFEQVQQVEALYMGMHKKHLDNDMNMNMNMNMPMQSPMNNWPYPTNVPG
ncbi:hypothetical protein HOO54_14655 [Bacillus sp. WMMC1349]|uniref:hypothetical protein n=1 Tax=Bacillus sp. WMMC1349 TaxID=2736254 RepID=UPI0015550CAC|nr:hypothetical protein [Bacillus sp. WMMC1349]NPC93441.1 hypothetical protein [Bacillus sp. WMMC1349]